MTIEFELDITDLEAATRCNSNLLGADVFGPQERVIGARDHVFRRARSGLLLNAQQFRVHQEFVYRIVRRDHLTLHFVVGGEYRVMIAGQSFRLGAGTIQISGIARSENLVLPTRRELVAVCLYVARQQLVDEFGLKVDHVPDAYRCLFNSQLKCRQGAAPLLELPMPPSAWVAVQEIVHCRFPEPLKSEYVGARAVELVCHAVAEINRLRPCDLLIGVAPATRERLKIETAEAIYRREIANPPSPEEVARRVGLNRNKLTAGIPRAVRCDAVRLFPAASPAPGA